MNDLETREVPIFVLLLSMLATTLASAQVVTTRSSLTAGRMGTSADLYGTVALYDRDAQRIECSGVLIAPDLVLTAAHCVVELDDDDEPQGPLPPERFAVIAGQVTLDTIDESHHYEVDTIVSHGDFLVEDIEDPTTGMGNLRDIALVFLMEPAFGVGSVPLLTPVEAQTALRIGAPVTLTGYGVHDVETLSDGVLHMGDATVARRLTYEMLVGGNGEADTCLGDSGGPIYVWVGGMIKVAGLASRGPDDSEVLCGDGTIAVVVPSFYDWVAESSAGRIVGGPPSIGGVPGLPPPPRCNCAVNDAPMGPMGLLVLLLLGGWRRRLGGRSEATQRPRSYQ